MGCLGVLFALTEMQVAALRKKKNDKARLEYVQEVIEERFFEESPELVAETDKSWDAIHRSLTDGSLAYNNGVFPLSHVILGGESLYSSEDYIMSLKNPDEVRDIARAIRTVSRDQLRAGYDRINPAEYGLPLTSKDFEYTWEWFSGLAPFWENAARSGRHVLFTADQ